MRFIYKIYTQADGFTPAEIPNRLYRGALTLKWTRYLESVKKGDRVWIYFRGPKLPAPGVYAKGSVRRVDFDKHCVRVKLARYRVDRPLTDQVVSDEIASMITATRLQVFLLPEIEPSKACILIDNEGTCHKRMCQACPTWNHLPLIGARSYFWPKRMPELSGFVPAYWVLPRRGFLHQEGLDIKAAAQRTSELFYRFKFGESALSYPLALGVAAALEAQGLSGFDCIVPIPLSPGKAKMGEIHRTKHLARELGSILNIPVRELLSLQWSISKHKVRVHQHQSASAFEKRYLSALRVSRAARRYRRILVLDDVATEGSTIRCASKVIRAISECDVFAATAGLMAVKAVVNGNAGLFG